jgi:N-acetylneuraminic acid mutarotase
MKTNNIHKKTKNTFIIIGLITAIVLCFVESTRAATWTQKADMPTARYALSTSVVGGKIYAFGGIGGLKKVEEYDPATDNWTQKADMPTGRLGLASSAVDGKIYAIGGTPFYRGPKLAAVEEYDPATNTWTQKADMPAPRAGQATCVVNGRIYAVGGSGSDGYIASVWEYDPATDTWTTKADIATKRNLAFASVVNGKIYCFGGQRDNSFPTHSTVEEYDPATDTWTKKADMPATRAWGCAGVLDEKIYAFGGDATKGGLPLSSLFRYDPATDTWTTEEDMPVRLGGLATSVVNGRAYVIGGTSATWPYDPHYLSTVWEYDVGITVPSPDFNGDGIVDGTDAAVMVDHWHTDSVHYDIAPMPFGDDFVDVQDLIALSEHFFEDVDDPTLIAHWALDEAEGGIAYDSVGENHGFVMGGAVWQPDAGQVNGALQLDGVDDVIVADTPLNPADGPFSVLAWVKGGGAGRAIISEPAGPDWLSLNPLTGHLMSELTSSGRSASSLQSEATITSGQWHRIGLVWDGLYRTLYVDGVAVAKDTQSSLASPGSGFYIGAGNAMASGTYFGGMIDDVRIYNRAVRP